MSDLIRITSESAPGQKPMRLRTLFRRVVKLMVRPGHRLFQYYQSETAARLEHLEARLNRTEWLADALYKQTYALSSQLDGLTQQQLSLQSHFDALVVQCDGLLRLLPGIDNRFETLDEKLSAVHALHWDHVALSRRLGAIEDVLAASGDAAKETLEEGRGRPLLPFPGLESPDVKKFRIS